ncbi:RNA polymerase sigma factor [Kitasatospora sp. LaBMicrA B282]|uniref:RNA polymerase sigma factor n=1 Tax=Kitasatospora sp. LaBMicrA B282 TaxID=3420949 RepID=UPI003D0C4F2E
MTQEAQDAVVRAFRSEWSRIVAVLIRWTGDWDLAEECAQEAFERALDRWSRDGVPTTPGAWLITTARNRAVDRLRRVRTEAAKLQELAMITPEPEPPPTDGSGITDDRLRLIFTCCHPALPLDARVALTLRTLTGLTTVEIARAFLVSDQTMAKRLVRAKAKIRNAHIPYRVPPGHLLPERTAGVLAVLYLLFNEGYSATEGTELIRTDLSGEAIRLARLLVRLMPDEPEAGGLLALMLLHDARRGGRLDAAGELVPLEEQDRSTWDADTIAEGCAVLEAAARRGRQGFYQLQAAIAACHATARTAGATDWARIARLYGALARLTPSPVIELNLAVARAMAEGPEVGLALLARLEEGSALVGYHLLPATRADLLRRLGRRREAAAAYREALELAGSDAERRYLRRRLGETGAEQATTGPGGSADLRALPLMRRVLIRARSGAAARVRARSGAAARVRARSGAAARGRAGPCRWTSGPCAP